MGDDEDIPGEELTSVIRSAPEHSSHVFDRLKKLEREAQP